MAVVRSLTTNLDFNVDFKTLNNFSRLLDGFNLKFALGGTAAAAFGTQIVRAISSVTDLILDTDALARSTGIAFEEINNLTQAATSLGRIDASQFQNILRTINKDVVDARLGLGRLRQIASGLNSSGVSFNIFDDNGRIADTLTVFERMVNAIRQIDDEQFRIRAFEDIFGGNGAELDKIFKDGYQAFKAVADTYNPISQALKDQREFAEAYEKNIRDISQSFNQIIQEFVTKFAPAIQSFSAAAKELIQLYNSYSKFVDRAVSNTAEALKDSSNPLSFYGRGLLPEDTWSPVAENNTNAPIQVENIFQVTLQPGTPEEQGRQLYEATTSALSGWWENQAQMIMNNNPQVE